MEMILSVQNLTKSYGKVRALKGVTFDVSAGSVFGILGPNGSGKTTLLGIILNVLRAGSGSFAWFGRTAGASGIRQQIGSLLETPNFYGYLSGTDNLRITQAISGRGTPADIDTVLRKVNLYERKWASFRSYSLGMKQRLAIAAALLGQPKVLVLDEPTNGLDPVGIAEIRNLIGELRQKGHTIIMASHLLDEVEKICTHAAILKEGTLITTGRVEEILRDDDIVELAAADLEQLAAVIGRLGRSIERANDVLLLHFPPGEVRLDEINRFCHENGVVLNRLLIKKKRLETRFFELTNN